MAGVVASVLLLGMLAAAPRVEPAEPRQGDLVVLKIADKSVDEVVAWYEGEPVPFAAVRSGWQALIGIDMLAAPGAREVTGVTVTAGKSQPWRVTFELADAGFPVQHIRLEDDSKVHLTDADLKRVVRENKEIGDVFRLRSQREWSGTFRHPLADAPAGGRFGSRRVINNEPRNPHSGADFAVPTGEPVHAVNAGRVVLVDDHFFAGRSIFIDHGDGMVTMYFHLSKALVKKGQEVKKGDIIGHVGASGRASGPHLHYGVRYRGARINPASLAAHDLE